MEKSISAGGIIINSAKKIIVTNQRGNSWSLPKGHVDHGETDLQAAYREIEEETGIREKSLTYLGVLGSYERYKISSSGIGEDKSELKEIRIFLFKTEENALKPTDFENPEARWVTPEEALSLLTHPKDKEFFMKVLPRITAQLKK